MDNPNSRVDLVKLRGRETVTSLATVNDLIVYRTDDNGLVVEFVKWDAKGKPLESYRITVCPEDADRIRNPR